MPIEPGDWDRWADDHWDNIERIGAQYHEDDDVEYQDDDQRLGGGNDTRDDYDAD